MLVSRRYLLIFAAFMIIIGVSVSVYGYLAKPIAIISLMSEEWAYSPKRIRGPYPDIFPLTNVLHLKFSSNYSTTIYLHYPIYHPDSKAYRLASNVTKLDLHFTLKELMGWNTTEVSWVYADFSFEPVRTPCAMKFNLMFERSYPRLGQYFSALGLWFLAVGIGPLGHSWLSKKLKEDITRLSLKLVLIASYFWTFVAIFYVFLGSDPHFFSPFYAAPLMRSLVIPLALSALATFVVLGIVLFYFLASHASLSTKLGFLFLFGFPLLPVLIYLVRPVAVWQTEIPIALFVASFGILSVLQTRSEQMRARPWLLPFLLAWVFLLTVYSLIHELGHYLVACFDEATISGVTWWWITRSGIQRPHILVDPESFSSIYVYVLCRLAGLLIILVPSSVLFFNWRLKRSAWWHFSFILLASSFAVSYDDLYNIGSVVQGPLSAVSLATASVLATGLLFFWYFYKKLPSIMRENIATEQTTSIVDR